MKKILLSLAAVFVLAVAVTSCSSNSPKAAADKFLTNLYHMNYKEAKEVATEDTKKMLEMMESFSAMTDTTGAPVDGMNTTPSSADTAMTQ